MGRAGWRYFECPECKKKWRETCRDHTTESRSLCIDRECKSALYGGVNPCGSEADKSLEVDKFGNLLHETVRELL